MMTDPVYMLKNEMQVLGVLYVGGFNLKCVCVGACTHTGLVFWFAVGVYFSAIFVDLRV